MRWLFLFMLALNLAYIGWQLSQSAPGAGRSVQGIDGEVPPIVLLRELPPEPAEVAEQSAAQPASVSADQADNSSAATPEAELTETAEPVTAEVGPAAEPAVSPPATACYTLGPFRELASLRKLIRDIRDYVTEAAFRSNEEREQTMYWVYLPAQSSRQAALALAENLQRKKIRDYYVLSDGEHENAVSLGHFREKQRALDLRAKVQKAGFEPLLEPVFKTYTLYWLDYQEQAGKVIPKSVLDLAKWPNVGRFARSCQ